MEREESRNETSGKQTGCKVSKARGTQAFHCSSQLSVENNNNRWIQSGQLLPEHPGAGEQMMKCESAFGGAGRVREVGVGGLLPHSHTYT